MFHVSAFKFKDSTNKSAIAVLQSDYLNFTTEVDADYIILPSIAIFLFKNYKNDVIDYAFNMMNKMADYAVTMKTRESNQNFLPAPSEYVIPKNADAILREYAFFKMYEESLKFKIEAQDNDPQSGEGFVDGLTGTDIPQELNCL